ncbi:AbiTii domain-containing protein [Aeromonas salmonicida]|uniref:AbiTii domain-containing protein n=1 Tax=Aeromonas salmonicida TaxID=645 RepID=UPI0037ED8517
MTALIPELIAMASDPTIKTADLLRKAKVAARQLQQPAWASWIDHELNGYPKDVKMPPYRLLPCAVKADIGTDKPVPLTLDVTEWMETLSQVPCPLSISALDAMALPGATLNMPLPADVTAALIKASPHPMVPVRLVGAHHVQALIDAVRNEVLDWALALAEAGIQGEGMTFTAKEQQQAQQVPSMSISIGGDVHGFQFMQSSPGGQQQQTVTGEQKTEALAALLPWLQQVIDEGQLSPLVQAELQANQTALQALANAPTRRWPVIGTLACSVRAILEGAGSEVLAAQALGWLATLSGS